MNDSVSQVDGIKLSVRFDKAPLGNFFVDVGVEQFGQNDFPFELDEFFHSSLRAFNYLNRDDCKYLFEVSAEAILSMWACVRGDYEGEGCGKFLDVKNYCEKIESYVLRLGAYAFNDIAFIVIPLMREERVILVVEDKCAFECIVSKGWLWGEFLSLAQATFPEVSWKEI